MKMVQVKDELPAELPKKHNTAVKTGLACWVLIPLILGILLTTALSVTIITILSPYWSNMGGKQTIFSESQQGNAIATIMGQSYQSFVQKFANQRNAIYTSFWNNLAQPNQPMIDSIVTNHLHSIPEVMNNPDFTSLYFDGTRSLKDLGWARVDANGQLMDGVVNVADLTTNQRRELNNFVATFPMLKSVFNSHVTTLDYIYLVSPSRVMVMYPLSRRLPQVAQMLQFSSVFPGAVSFAVMISRDSTLFEFCARILRSNDVSEGIICIGLNMELVSFSQEVLFTAKQEEHNFFVTFSDIQQTTWQTTIGEIAHVEEEEENGENQDQVGQVVFDFPPLLELIFADNPTSEQAQQFNQIFQGVLITPLDFNSNPTVLYQQQYRNNANDREQLVVQQIFAFENGIQQDAEVTPLQVGNLVIQQKIDKFLTIFTELGDNIQGNIFYQIVFLTMGIALIVCLVAWYIAIRIIRGIVLPVQDLNWKLSLLSEDTMVIDIYSNYKPSSFEVNHLYQTFHELITVLNFSNQKYFEGDEATLLIKYAQGLKVFNKINSYRGIGVNKNNIGNIFRKQGKYEEALKCYRDALQACEDDLLETFEKTDIKEIFPESQCSSPSHLAQSIIQLSQRKKSGRKFQNKLLKSSTLANIKQNRRGSTKSNEIKRTLEDQYANRNYQLAKTLFEYAQIKEDSNSISQVSECRGMYEEALQKLGLALRIHQQQLNFPRIISTRLLILRLYLKLQQKENAYAQLQEAENVYNNYEQNCNDIHAVILKQKILLEKGIYCKELKNNKLAAKQLTSCIETGKYYDPFIRRQCLLNLKEIFENQEMLYKVANIPRLLRLTERKKHKDMVFALDFSESMGKDKKRDEAVCALLKIYDEYVENQDKIGFLKFNNNIDVVFGLTEKGVNDKFLRSAIEAQILQQPSGLSALLQAITIALDIHDQAYHDDHLQYVVVFTDGQDNFSRISYSKMQRMLDRHPHVGLIIVGVALHSKQFEPLNEITRMTRDGVFIESVNSEDLDIVFQSLKNFANAEYQDMFIESYY